MATTMNEKVERGGLRLLAVVSVACILTAFGCTTNRTAGNGQPTSSGPALGPASPTTTPGSSSGTAGNPPMASSAIPIDPTQPSSVDALAVLAADQAYQGRVLGKVNPDGAQTNEPTPPTGQFVNPALVVNPQSTVNSSISSAQIAPGITGGSVGGGGALAIGPATAAMIATTGAPNAPTTAAATNAAIPTMSNTAIAASTNSAIATPSNAAIVGTSNATITTVPSQSALATATPTTTARSTSSASTTKASTKKATTSRKTARAKAAVKTPTTVTTAPPVRVETNPTGEVVVTNTNPPKQ